MTTLRGMTWDHPRGLRSVQAATAAYASAHPEVRVQWEVRSLQDFADLPLQVLADHYDLVVFDHPFIGEVARSQMLVALDTVLPAEYLDDQAGHTVGSSYASYRWEGHQWALAIDAACHVAVRRPDLIDHMPGSWTEAVELGRELDAAGGPRLGLPLLAIDSLLTVFTMLAGRGGAVFDPDGSITDPEAASEAVERVAELAGFAHPGSLEWNPIRLLDVMSTSDDVAFSPVTFGYVNYATPGFRDRLLEFEPVPGGRGGVLGGAGLGVSAYSTALSQAVDVARYIASGDVQSTRYVEEGGQPGHRSAWTDLRLDAAHGRFFSATLPGIDASFLRPRWSGYLPAQTRAADRLHDWLRRPDVSSRALAWELSDIFARAWAASPDKEAA